MAFKKKKKRWFQEQKKCFETHHVYPNLIDQQQLRLNKINEVKDYFIVVIKERELMSKRLSTHIVSSDCLIFFICSK